MDIQFGDPRLPKRFWDKVNVNKETGCWEWTASRNTKGYGWYGISSGKPRSAHRVVYETLIGSIGDFHCLHKCDVPCCVNPTHLFLGTNADNVADRVAKNRQARGEQTRRSGEDSGNSKLTNEDVREIRRLYTTGELSQLKIAKIYGISNGHVSLIVNRKSWPYLNVVVAAGIIGYYLAR